MGLPDLGPIQQALMSELQKNFNANFQVMAPNTMLKTWFPANWQNLEEAQKAFWSHFQKTMSGFASTTANAMLSIADRNDKR